MGVIALRRTIPRGRFLIFAASSSGALFGCAALGGEVGIVSPAAWFAIVMAALVALAAVAVRAGHPKARTA